GQCGARYLFGPQRSGARAPDERGWLHQGRRRVALARPAYRIGPVRYRAISRLCRARQAQASQGPVRIDRFLHCIRLVKSRTLAQSIIDEGQVRIDGKRVEKASEEVRAGSVVA